MTHEKFTTKAGFAKIIGKSPAAVAHYAKSGRIVMKGKQVDVEASIERLEKTGFDGWANKCKYDSTVGHGPQVSDNVEELKETVGASQLDLETQDATELFANARALREKAAALQSAAEYDKYTGKLVSKDVVAKIMFERARQFRDGLMTCARRTAPLLADKNSSPEIEEILTEEFRYLLENFSEMPLVKDDN